jgi:hypothetical protein
MAGLIARSRRWLADALIRAAMKVDLEVVRQFVVDAYAVEQKVAQVVEDAGDDAPAVLQAMIALWLEEDHPEEGTPES